MLPLRILMKICQPVLIIKAHRFILSVLFALLSILLLAKPIWKYLSSHKPIWWCHAIITQNPSLSFSFHVPLSYSLKPFSIVLDRLFITSPKTSHYRLYYSDRPLGWCTGAPLSLQLNQGAKLLTRIVQKLIEFCQLSYKSHFTSASAGRLCGGHTARSAQTHQQSEESEEA